MIEHNNYRTFIKSLNKTSRIKYVIKRLTMNFLTKVTALDIEPYIKIYRMETLKMNAFK